ncbi:neurocan core protein-like [Heterodontus francisci]|uniref:neurocan core protein-like n=1 Tax=Heterodontus francisci TaxID=7792 RepID=UPI00355B5357
MDGFPGVRNYGTQDPEDLYDVYCYVEDLEGTIFVSNSDSLSFEEATLYCEERGTRLATTGELYAAWSGGLDHCTPGWLFDGSVRYPIVAPRERCGGPLPGVKTIYAFHNQTGLLDPASLHGAFCFLEMEDSYTETTFDYFASMRSTRTTMRVCWCRPRQRGSQSSRWRLRLPRRSKGTSPPSHRVPAVQSPTGSERCGARSRRGVPTPMPDTVLLAPKVGSRPPPLTAAPAPRTSGGPPMGAAKALPAGTGQHPPARVGTCSKPRPPLGTGCEGRPTERPSSGRGCKLPWGMVLHEAGTTRRSQDSQAPPPRRNGKQKAARGCRRWMSLNRQASFWSHRDPLTAAQLQEKMEVGYRVPEWADPGRTRGELGTGDPGSQEVPSSGSEPRKPPPPRRGRSPEPRRP